MKKIANVRDTLIRRNRFETSDACVWQLFVVVIRVRVESDSNPAATTTTTTTSKRRDETFLDFYSFRVGSTTVILLYNFIQLLLLITHLLWWIYITTIYWIRLSY